jgi:hypothetical protein
MAAFGASETHLNRGSVHNPMGPYLEIMLQRLTGKNCIFIFHKPYALASSCSYLHVDILEFEAVSGRSNIVGNIQHIYIWPHQACIVRK